MGPMFADIDGDGRLDLWVTDSKYNRLMRNTGRTASRTSAPSAGISQANAQYVSWGSGIYDFDNDGMLDILIFHGGLIHLVPAGALAVPRTGQRQVRRCFARGRRLCSM